MKFCQKCGKEIMDEAKFCESCGTTVEIINSSKKDIEEKPSIGQNAVNLADEEKTQPTVKKLKKIVFNKWFIIICAVVLVIGLLAAVLFIPRDLKMDDFKKTNVVSAILKYRIPESISTNVDDETYLCYDDKLDFYGITPIFCSVYPEENRVVFFFPKEDGYDVYKKISKYCKFEDIIGYSGGGFHKFSYGDLEITTYAYDGSYVNIEIY